MKKSVRRLFKFSVPLARKTLGLSRSAWPHRVVYNVEVCAAAIRVSCAYGAGNAGTLQVGMAAQSAAARARLIPHGGRLTPAARGDVVPHGRRSAKFLSKGRADMAYSLQPKKKIGRAHV